jgi:putative flippase GtrA
MTPEFQRLLRFGTVGALNTLLTLISFLALTRAGTPTVAASALAFAVGATNGYVLNRRWTFRSDRRGMQTMLRYVTVQALGAAVSAGGIALVSSDLAVQHLTAEAIVLPAATLTTYVLVRRVVFGADPAVTTR